MFLRFLIAAFVLLGAFADAGSFERGEALFKKECGSCHAGYIPAERLKKNFFESNNTLLRLKAPTVNMLAYAITRGPRKIGDPSDSEMRQAEVEAYLEEALTHPDRDESICDRTLMRYYALKKPFGRKLTEGEYADLARYFLDYRRHRLARESKRRSVKKLSDFPDEKAILAEAKRQHKRLIIEAESEYCHYCKTMKKKVIDAPDVSRILSRDFLLVSVDVGHSKLPFGLQKVYRRITPSFFFLDSDGKLINHYPGSWNRHDFLQILEENREKRGGN